MDQVVRLYRPIIKMSGGEHGYLSRSNLDCLLDPVKDVGERLQRRQAIVKKAAFLLYDIIVIHPFLNGNKRTASELMKLFLRANGFKVVTDDRVAYRFLLGVASGKVPESEVEAWRARHLIELAV